MINRNKKRKLEEIINPYNFVLSHSEKTGTTDTNDMEKQPRTCPYCTTELVKATIYTKGNMYAEKLFPGGLLPYVSREIVDLKEEVWACPECKTIIR